MKIAITLSAACALLTSAPAAAQLLGGSAGGGLGGTLGGVLGAPGPVGQGVGSTLDAGGATRIDRSIDRRSGRAEARAAGDAQGSGGLDAATAPLFGSGNASARGEARASGDTGLMIDAIGTDAVGSLAGQAAGTARGAVSGLAGNASGAASGSGAGQAGGGVGLGPLAAAGALSVAPGMAVRDTAGRAIGTVQDVRATANGLVDTVLVAVGDRVAALPADNFSVSGDALVSAMGRGEVRREARQD